MRKLWRHVSRLTVATMLCAAAGVAQTPPALKAFHPEGPLAAFDVATIKPADPEKQFAGTTIRRYIAGAYDVSNGNVMLPGQQTYSRVIGGPEWVDKDRYDIKGKPPDEVREAMQKMPNEQRAVQNRMMQQSLLAERFHLKVHFEMRETTIFELVPAKGGLKIAPVDPPAPPSEMAQALPPKPGDPPPAGGVRISITSGGVTSIEARAVTAEMLGNMVRNLAPEIGGKPVVDMTGFQGKFDVKDFRFLGTIPPQVGGGSTNNIEPPDAPSLTHELEEKLGMKLVSVKGQAEVVVIDSIDRPTEN